MNIIVIGIACLVASAALGAITAHLMARVRATIDDQRIRRKHLFLVMIIPLAIVICASLFVFIRYPDHQGLMGCFIGGFVGTSCGLQGTFAKMMKKRMEAATSEQSNGEATSS